MIEFTSEEGTEERRRSRFRKILHRKSSETNKKNSLESKSDNDKGDKGESVLSNDNEIKNREMIVDNGKENHSAAVKASLSEPVDIFKSGLVSPLEKDRQLGEQDDNREVGKNVDADKEEDIDVAHPVTEMRPLGYLVNLLSSAPSASGISASLKKLKQQYLYSGDKLDSDDGGKSDKVRRLAYGIQESDTDTSADEDDKLVANAEEQANDKTLNGYTEGTLDTAVVNDGDETLNNNGVLNIMTDLKRDKETPDASAKLVDGELINPSPRGNMSPQSGEQSDVISLPKSDVANESAGSSIFNAAPNTESSKATTDIDLESLSAFQKSIVEKLNPHSISESMFAKLKEGQGIGEDRRKRFERKYVELKLKIAKKLQKVFELDNDDIFYGNFDVWLVKDVLLQGHLYLTRDSLLFFAFLPRRFLSSSGLGKYTKEDDSEFIVQSGSLGLKTAKYGESVFNTVITHRFWAVLRTETLSIYSSPTDLYFPKLIIDLKSCTKVEIMDKPSIGTKTPFKYGYDGVLSPRNLMKRSSSDSLLNDEDQENSLLDHESNIDDHPEGITGGVWFKLHTKKKTYKFYTDNLYVARQWYSNITKSIFQINNSNSKDEVLIKIPIENILNYKNNQLFESSDISEEEEENGDKEEKAGKTQEDPTSIFIRYVQDQIKGDDFRTSSTREKWKRGIKYSTGQHEIDDQAEHIRFLFFSNVEKFVSYFEEVLSLYETVDTQESVISMTRSERLYQKAKRMVGKEYTTEIRPRYHKFFSTLKPSENESAILDQLSQQKQAIHNLNLAGNDVHKSDEALLNSSKLKIIGKSIAHPTKIFSSRRSIEAGNSIPSSGQLSPILPKSAETASIGSREGVISKSISLTGLKNMQMYFQKSERDVSDAEIEYKHDGQSTIERDEKQNNDLVFSDEDRIPGPLLLSEPSDILEDINKKQTKISSIKNGIKSLSVVSSLFSTNPYHYQKAFEDDVYYVNDESIRQIGDNNFKRYFSLNESRYLIASYYIHLHRTFPVYGKLYLGNEELCFRSLLPGVSTLMVLPLRDVEQCWKDKGIKIAHHRLVIRLKGQEELNFEFGYSKSRDDCELMLLRQIEGLHSGEDWKPKMYEWGENHGLKVDRKDVSSSSYFDSAGSQNDSDIRLATLKIERARLKMFEDKVNSSAGLDVPIILEDSPFVKTEIKPSTSYRFTLLTIGSRGDVQPYIALGKGLLAEGHHVTIASHLEFKDWVVKHGMDFREIAGDPAELMSLMVTHGSMSVSFLKEASSKFRGWIQDLLKTSWDACQGTDILIESPSAMGGLHIAEALGIPYIRAFTMPWTRTRAYPHAFIVPDQKKGGSYNYLTHVMFETVFWKGISGQVNKWRMEELGLPRTNLNRMQQTKIPFLYNISPTIFPPSVDFPDWVKVTGYWFLDEASAADFTPPQGLVKFLEQAYKDNKKVVYIGFGSIVVNDAKKMTKAVVEAVLQADVRCVLNKGWSDRLNKDVSEPEVELPPEVYNSGAISHDWLFPRIDGAVHHGGSGTTGATMRAGLPTVIKPFFGDQFFYASRLEEIGTGLGLRKLNVSSLSKALKTITTDTKIIEKANQISERIKHENGVMSAVEAIYSELEYARSLILTKQLYNESYQHSHGGIFSGAQTPVVHEEGEEDDDSEYEEDVSFDEEIEDVAAVAKPTNPSITMLSSKRK